MVRIWDANGGEPLLTMSGGAAIAYRPDGRALPGVGIDGHVRTWARDLPDGQVTVTARTTAPTRPTRAERMLAPFAELPPSVGATPSLGTVRVVHRTHRLAAVHNGQVNSRLPDSEPT
jgi:hypothetical protein